MQSPHTHWTIFVFWPYRVHDGLVALQLTKNCSYFEVLHQVLRSLSLAALHGWRCWGPTGQHWEWWGLLLQRLNLCLPPLHLKLKWDREQTAPPGLLPLLQMLKDGRLGMLLLLPLLQVAGAVPQSTVLLILLLRWNLTALPILVPKG